MREPSHFPTDDNGTTHVIRRGNTSKRRIIGIFRRCRAFIFEIFIM